MTKNIEKGDTVNVFFERNALFNLKVEKVPCATGDSWVLIDPENKVYRVMLFNYMEKISE